MNGLALAELTSVVAVSVGASVWIKSRRTSIGSTFFLFACTVALWTASNGLVHSFGASPFGPLWGRLAFFFASLIPVSFFLFVPKVFPSAEPSTPLVRYLSERLDLERDAASALLILDPSHPSSHGQSSTMSLAVTYGPLHLAFGVYFVTCLMSALYLLNQEAQETHRNSTEPTPGISLLAVFSTALRSYESPISILPLWSWATRGMGSMAPSSPCCWSD